MENETRVLLPSPSPLLGLAVLSVNKEKKVVGTLCSVSVDQFLVSRVR